MVWKKKLVKLWYNLRELEQYTFHYLIFSTLWVDKNIQLCLSHRSRTLGKIWRPQSLSFWTIKTSQMRKLTTNSRWEIFHFPRCWNIFSLFWSEIFSLSVSHCVPGHWHYCCLPGHFLPTNHSPESGGADQWEARDGLYPGDTLVMELRHRAFITLG